MGHWIKRAAGRRRDAESDRRLARWLTVVAGAANAGGFMAVGTYTSHMTGVVSGMADSLAVGAVAALAAGIGALAAFLVGAAVSAILVNLARRREMTGEFALPLALESGLLALFGISAPLARAYPGVATAATVGLLCFVMGLQNAMITKLSDSRIRTTHVTGMATDLGIELGKAFYRNDPRYDGERPPVRTDREKLSTLAELVALFFLSGVAGALAFKLAGQPAALVLSAITLALAVGPLWEDFRSARRG